MSVFSVSIRELRPRLPEVVNNISENMNRYIITKRGKPTAVILNIDDYDSLIESLKLESNWRLIKELKESEEDLKAKKGRLIEEIRKEL